MERMPRPAQGQSERYWYLDLLRITAVFTVVLLHVSPQATLEVAVHSAPWQVMNLLASLCAFKVPVMFMISGALFLSPGRQASIRRLYGKNLARLVASFCFWSAFYALAYCAVTGKGKWTFINQFLRGHYHMWFLFELIGLYAITPLLRQITASKRATQYLLLAGLVFSFIPNRALAFASLFSVPHADVLASLQSAFAQTNPYRGLHCAYYFVLGHYLHEYALSRRGKRLLLASGAAAVAATFLLTAWQSGRAGETSTLFYSNDSLNVLLASAAVFVLFRELFGRLSPGEEAKAWIMRLSKYAFGVYLIHPFLIERLNAVFPLTAPALLVSILGITAGVWALSCVIAAVIHRIPVLRKYIV